MNNITNIIATKNKVNNMNTNVSKKVIGFVFYSDPMKDRKVWSGIPYKMREAIEKAGYNVIWIRYFPNKFLSFFVKAMLKIIGSTKYWEFTKIYFWLCARSVNTDDVKKCDYLVFPGGAHIINYLNINLPPVIYYTDASFCQLLNYYWFDIPKWICRQANDLEKKTIELSSLVIRASNWAINCAINDYGCSVEKTAVLEFGANIDDNDIMTTKPYTEGELRILFSGVDWKRKGGDVAVETVKILNEHGYKTKLYLVGIDKVDIPFDFQNLDFVEYVGFLNKNDSQQYKRYIETIKNCHCLLLPTHAECAGIVFCEAAAYGLPSFTYDTGGINNYVINGNTGYLLNTNMNAADFAEVIERVIRKKEFESLHQGAMTLYKEKTSWNAWSQRFSEILNNHFKNFNDDNYNKGNAN